MKQDFVLFILVNYFNEKEVSSFVEKELKGIEGVRVVIVDNGSTNTELLNNLVNKYSFVQLSIPGKNLGYMGGANFGLNKYLERYNEYSEFTILCNTDLSFSNKFNISDLLKAKEKTQFDVMGPDIYSDFLQYHQNPYIKDRISVSKLKFFKSITSVSLLYTLFTFYHLLKKKIIRPVHINTTTHVYAVHGSFICFAKSFFDQGGALNYPSFLYGEEIFIAELARKLGLKVMYEPSIQIVHHEHSTTGTIKSSQNVKFLHQSYSYLLKEFFQ